MKVSIERDYPIVTVRLIELCRTNMDFTVTSAKEIYQISPLAVYFYKSYLGITIYGANDGKIPFFLLLN